MKYFSTQRILSIDVFRGITIFAMVFANELAGISDVPQWMKHLPADVDGMTFVDLIFPAFLFIVGMSIPFATQARLTRNDAPFDIFKHILLRSFGLIVIGVFMVNAESGYDASAMPIPIALWTLLMFGCVLLIWSHYPRHLPVAVQKGFPIVGIVGLVMLWAIYHNPQGGGMTPQWWGILGLIGWAYLIAASLYLLVLNADTAWKQSLLIMLAITGLMLLFVLVDRIELFSTPAWSWLDDNKNGFTHAAIVLAGTLLAQLVYHEALGGTRLSKISGYAVVALIAALVSWQFSPISKIWATPSWSLFSIFYCSVIFALIYWITQVRQQQRWCRLFEPAAVNPLLVYILPFILLALSALTGFYLRPALFNAGTAGILWSLGFACAMLALGALLTRAGLRVKL